MPERLIDLNIREKRFGDRPVLGHTALTVARGEIVSLVGASGCGKSTLLRIVAGLDTAYDGTVSVLGHEPRLHARDVGFVFQEPRLLPWLTVAQNVGFERGAKGAKDNMVQTLLAEVGLDGQGSAYPKELSGGMAQRAAIARALFSRPDILLLDEPFSAVDPFTRMKLQDLLLSVAERHGATLLVVTHDIAEAVYLSDRVLAVANRAGGITGEVEISIGRPRNRHDPNFSQIQGRILLLFEGSQMEAA